jgi:hypothetical protein
MKRKTTLNSILALLFIFLANATFAQQKPSADRIKELQQKYNSRGSKQENTFDKFLQLNSKSISTQVNGLYNSCDRTETLCSNSDF